MNLNLHHAVTSAATALTEISAVSFYMEACRASDLAANSLARARKQLAEAERLLTAYETEVAVKAAVKSAVVSAKTAEQVAA